MKDENGINRFVEAQQGDYEDALAEITAGEKQSHWIGYVFPQLKGLGMSWTSEFYGIANLNEAKAYLAHPVLGARLREISTALLKHRQKSARAGDARSALRALADCEPVNDPTGGGAKITAPTNVSSGFYRI